MGIMQCGSEWPVFFRTYTKGNFVKSTQHLPESMLNAAHDQKSSRGQLLALQAVVRCFKTVGAVAKTGRNRFKASNRPWKGHVKGPAAVLVQIYGVGRGAEDNDTTAYKWPRPNSIQMAQAQHWRAHRNVARQRGALDEKEDDDADDESIPQDGDVFAHAHEPVRCERKLEPHERK
eukprot:6198788-Pleurochrysis_carterae.AAC.3